jgi:hypothetical protein
MELRGQLRSQMEFGNEGTYFRLLSQAPITPEIMIPAAKRSLKAM